MLKSLRSLDNNQGLFLNELIEIFENDSGTVVDRLIRAIDENSSSAPKIAHKLKGMGANIGTQRLAAVLEDIEANFESFDSERRAKLPASIRFEHAEAMKALRASWWSAKAG